jgi:hypothetical protein
LLSEEQKAKILRARNRDNARRTRKRKKLYVNFIDKALKALETALGVTSSSSASQTTKLEDDGRSDNDNEESCQDMEDVKQEQIGRVDGKLEGRCSSDFSRQRTNSSTAVEIDSSSRSSSSFPSVHSLGHVKDPRQISSSAATSSGENELTSRTSSGAERRHDTHNTALCEGERRKMRTPVPRCSMESSVTKSNLLAKRVRYMRAYLKLRHSPLRDLFESGPGSGSGPGTGPASPSKVAEWLTVCAADVVHVTPLAAYRQAKDLHQMGPCPPDCMYECRGVDAVAMDCQRIAEYFDSLRGASSYEVSSPYKGANHCSDNSGSAKSKLHRHWFASFAMDSDNATLCDNGSTLLVCYTLTVQVVDQKSSLTLKSDCTSPRVFPYPFPAAAITQLTQPRAAAVTAGNSPTPSSYRHQESASSSSSSASSSSSNSSSNRASALPQRLDQRRQTDCKSEDDVEADLQEDKDDDDICKWLEMALDTTYIRDPTYQRRRTVSVGRDFSEQEISRVSFTGSAADDGCESDSDGEEEESTPPNDRKTKRSKMSSSGADSDMCGAAEMEPLPAASGTVLFKLCIQARVEFGGSGCDSDGRILRITEHFSAPRDSPI